MRGKWIKRGLYGLVLIAAVALGIALGAASAWATVDTTHNKATYSGNGSTTSFPYDFRIFDDDDLKVILVDSDGDSTTLTLGDDYSVTGAGDEGGGNVVMDTAPASGTTLVVLRELEITQGTAYPPNSPFPAQAHENALDRLTMIAQQVDEALSRAIKLPEQETGTDLAMPEPQSGACIGWSADGTELVNDPADLAAAVSAAAQAISANASAQAAAAVAVANASPAPGYIAGMQISRSSTTAITIQPGVCEIGGKLYVLESAVTISVATTTALSWRAVRIVPPSGNTLTSSNFSDTAASNITKSADGTYWHHVGYPAYRAIGMYPSESSAVISGFRIYGDKYYCYSQVIDDSTPPTTVTNYNVGLPVTSDAAGMVGHFIASASATGGGSRILISCGLVMLQAGGDYVGGWLHLRSTDGDNSFYVASTGGTPSDLDVRLYYLDIPAGMAK